MTIPETEENSSQDLRLFGLAAGEFVVLKDFDAALPEEILAAFESLEFSR